METVKTPPVPELLSLCRCEVSSTRSWIRDPKQADITMEGTWASNLDPGQVLTFLPNLPVQTWQKDLRHFPVSPEDGEDVWVLSKRPAAASEEMQTIRNTQQRAAPNRITGLVTVNMKVSDTLCQEKNCSSKPHYERC